MALGCYFSEKKKYKSLNTELLNVNSGSVDKAMTMLNLVFCQSAPPSCSVLKLELFNWFPKKKKKRKNGLMMFIYMSDELSSVNLGSARFISFSKSTLLIAFSDYSRLWMVDFSSSSPVGIHSLWIIPGVFLRLNQFGYKLSSPLVSAVSQQARVISTLSEMMCFLFHCAACVCASVSPYAALRNQNIWVWLVRKQKRILGRCWHFEGVYFLSVLVVVICPLKLKPDSPLNFLKCSQVPLWYMPNCSASSVDTDPSVDL